VRLTCSLGRGGVSPGAGSAIEGEDASARVATPLVLRNHRRVAIDRRNSFTAPPPYALSLIINEHQALVSSIPRSTLSRAIRILEPLGEMRGDVEDCRCKIASVGHEFAHD
jgi:hypothetical protein